MKAFKLDDGTILNPDHVVEIPSNEIVNDAEIRKNSVGIRMSAGYIKQISVLETKRLRNLFGWQ